MRTKIGMILMTMVLGMSLGAIGCGDDGTSVDGNKKLSELTITEIQDFCLDIAKSLSMKADDFKKIGCTAAGLLAGGMAGTEDGINEQACEQAYDACMQQDLPGNIDFPSAEESCRLDEIELSDCDVTVNEVKACLQDTMDLMQEMMSQLSCSMTEMPDFENVENEVASCTKIAERCPSFSEEE